MFERTSLAQSDRRDVLVLGLLPAGLTILTMAVAFSVIGGLMLAAEGLVLSNIATRLFALAVMFVLPQFLVGLWMGYKYGLSAGPPLAAGFAPIGFLIVSLAAFGGPVSSPFGAPVLTLTAVVVWSLVCACGVLLGARFVRPRLGSA